MTWTSGHDGRKWHRCFAWEPIRIGDEWVWLEWIERKDTGSYDTFYEYRRISQSTIGNAEIPAHALAPLPARVLRAVRAVYVRPAGE